MLLSYTFVETKTQRLLDGLIFVKKGLGVHVQHMLKMSRDLYTGGNFKQNTWKNEGKLGTLLAIMVWQINDLVPTIFFIKIYYATTACTTANLYIRKMLTNREIINFQKWDFFRLIFILLL